MHPPHRRNSAPPTVACATLSTAGAEEQGLPSSPHLLYFSRVYHELHPPPDPNEIFFRARKGNKKPRLGGGRGLPRQTPAMYMDKPSLLAANIQSNRPTTVHSAEVRAQFAPQPNTNEAEATPTLCDESNTTHPEESALVTLEKRLNDLQARELHRTRTMRRSPRRRISRAHSFRSPELKAEPPAPPHPVHLAETAEYNRKVAEEHIDQWYESARVPPSKPTGAPLPRERGAATKIASLHRGKFRPNTAPMRSSVKDSEGKRHQFLDHILDERIENYEVVQAVAEQPLPLMARDRVPMEDYGLVAETNFARLKHAFRRQQYQKQAELEDFLVWRQQCQQVVQDKVANQPKKGSPNDNLIREMIEPTMSKRGGPHQQQGKGSQLQSIWTSKAYSLAVSVEKDRLCEELKHFQPPENAAQLSIKAVNTLRTQLIRFIKAEPCDFSKPPLSRERFFKFLTLKGHVPAEVSRRALATDDESELVGLMTSPAEAAFVHYVLTCIQ